MLSLLSPYFGVFLIIFTTFRKQTGRHLYYGRGGGGGGEVHRAGCKYVRVSALARESLDLARSRIGAHSAGLCLVSVLSDSATSRDHDDRRTVQRGSTTTVETVHARLNT